MWATRSTSKVYKHKVKDHDDDSSDEKQTQSVFRLHNEIHFSNDITYESMHELIKILKEAEFESLKHVAACSKSLVLSNDEKKVVDLKIEPKPIVLFITTHGGCVYAALGAVNIIETLRVPVHTVVSGYVASAGTLLSMAGKKRYIAKHSFMLIHELRSSFWGKYTDARDQIENLDKLMKMVISFTKEHSKILESDLKDLLSRDKNWDVEECLERGLVDEVYNQTRFHTSAFQ